MRRENFSYILRTVAGLYLIYLAYQLLGGYMSKEAGVSALVAAIAFAAVGVICIFNVVSSIVKSRMPQESQIEKEYDKEQEEAEKNNTEVIEAEEVTEEKTEE